MTVAHDDAACGLAVREGKVLLVENRRLVGGRFAVGWDLPGGRVEPGESLADAVRREWHEEVGLAASVGELLFVEDGVVRDADGAPPASTWRTYVFAVEADGEPESGPGRLPWDWVPLEACASRLVLPYQQALRSWLSGRRSTHATVEWIDPQPAARTGADMLLDLVAAAAVGDGPAVSVAALAHRRSGAAPAALLETLLLVVPYAGVPRAIAAFQHAAEALRGVARPRSAPLDEAARRARGRACFEAVYGRDAERVRAALEAAHPDLAAWIEGHAYGEVLARDGSLPLVRREVLAVAFLAALGNLEAPLRGHMKAALSLGAKAEDIEQALDAASRVAPRFLVNSARRQWAALRERN